MANDLVTLITEKRERFQRLTEELSVLRKELDEARLLLAEQRQSKRPHRRHTRGRPKDDLRPDSSAGYAREALRDFGSRMHADELMREIEKRGHPVNKGTLVGQLTRYVNRRQIFTRPEPNTFGLLEWGSDSVKVALVKG